MNIFVRPPFQVGGQRLRCVYLRLVHSLRGWQVPRRHFLHEVPCMAPGLLAFALDVNLERRLSTLDALDQPAPVGQVALFNAFSTPPLIDLLEMIQQYRVGRPQAGWPRELASGPDAADLGLRMPPGVHRRERTVSELQSDFHVVSPLRLDYAQSFLGFRPDDPSCSQQEETRQATAPHWPLSPEGPIASSRLLASSLKSRFNPLQSQRSGCANRSATALPSSEKSAYRLVPPA